MQVIARGSSNQYRGSSKPPEEIARELGAELPPDRHGAMGQGASPAAPSRVRVIPELLEIAPRTPPGPAGSTRSTRR